jgi:hypothetical protein
MSNSTKMHSFDGIIEQFKKWLEIHLFLEKFIKERYKLRYIINYNSPTSVVGEEMLIKQLIFNKLNLERNVVYKQDTRLIEETIYGRIKIISERENISMDIENYEEIEGSLIIAFTLIIESIAVFNDLQEFVEYVHGDIENLISTNGLSVSGSIKRLPSTSRLQAHQRRKRRNRFLATLGLLALATVLAYLKWLEDHEKKEPQQMEIKIIGVDSLIKNHPSQSDTITAHAVITEKKIVKPKTK